MQFLGNEELTTMKRNYENRTKYMQRFREPAYKYTIEETRSREDICEKKEFI